MDKRTVVLIVILFILVIAGMFIFAYLKKSETRLLTPTQFATTTEPTIKYPQITRITAKHFFIDGKHTFVGDLELPTQCDLLDTKATVRESFPEQVTLDFFVINNSEACPAVPTSQRFVIEAEASAEAKFTAMFMDRQVELNIVPPAPGETPEDFELFIKG